MFLFYHLLLAHVSADFAFQPKELINWKKKSIWGILVHNLIFIVLTGIFCVTYIGNIYFILYVFILTLIRMIIDYVNTRITGNIRLDNIMTFLIQHLLRILIIVPVLMFPQLNKINPMETSAFSAIYNNDTLILYLIFFIITVYGGSFIIFNLKKTFIDPSLRFDYDHIGIIERLMIFTLFILGGKYILFIPLIMLAKGFILFSNLKSSILNISAPTFQFQKIKLKSSIFFDLLVSPIFSILTGIILKSL